MALAAQEVAESRRLRRWSLIYYLRVFDRDNGHLLGHVVDITTEGVRLVSNLPLKAGHEYNAWMELPRENGETGKIFLDLRAEWIGRDANPDLFDAGMKLTHLTDQTIACIRWLIEDLQFDD